MPTTETPPADVEKDRGSIQQKQKKILEVFQIEQGENEKISLITSDKKDAFASLNEKQENQDILDEIEQQNKERAKLQTKRNADYTILVERFVDHYGDKYLQNRTFKKHFFYTVLALFSLTLVFPILILLVASLGKIGSAETIVASISAVGSIIASIMVIPKIIAEYLFSQKEDETIIGMIREVYQGDNQTR